MKQLPHEVGQGTIRSTMGKTLLILLFLVSALLGAADSFYLADSALNGKELTCNFAIFDGCNTVAQSPYSHVFGIPLGVYGVVFYISVFLLGSLFVLRPRKQLLTVLVYIATFGLAASLYFLYLQLAVIGATCIYCMISLVCATVIFLSAYGLSRGSREPVATSVVP
jgi:uncharacterized membrane protein